MKKKITLLTLLTLLLFSFISITVFAQVAVVNADSVRIGNPAATGNVSIQGKAYLKNLVQGNSRDSILVVNTNGQVKFIKRTDMGNNGIPVSTDDNPANASTTTNLLFNTTLQKLRVYDPATASWKDANPSDFSNYYTKSEIDALAATIPLLLVSLSPQNPQSGFIDITSYANIGGNLKVDGESFLNSRLHAISPLNDISGVIFDRESESKIDLRLTYDSGASNWTGIRTDGDSGILAFGKYPFNYTNGAIFMQGDNMYDTHNKLFLKQGDLSNYYTKSVIDSLAGIVNSQVVFLNSESPQNGFVDITSYANIGGNLKVDGESFLNSRLHATSPLNDISGVIFDRESESKIDLRLTYDSGASNWTGIRTDGDSGILAFGKYPFNYTNGAVFMQGDNLYDTHNKLFLKQGDLDGTFIKANPAEPQTGNVDITGAIYANASRYGNATSNVIIGTGENETSLDGYSYISFSAVDQVTGPIQMRFHPDLGQGLRIYNPDNPTNTGVGNNDWRRIIVEGDLDNSFIKASPSISQTANINISGAIENPAIYASAGTLGFLGAPIGGSGAPNIAIGDNDTGINWYGDGDIAFRGNSSDFLRFTPGNLLYLPITPNTSTSNFDILTRDKSSGELKIVEPSALPLSSNVTLAALTAADSSLTFSGSYTGATERTIGLNLGNANIWTATQTLPNPVFTGVPVAPTAALGTNTTQVATMAAVHDAQSTISINTQTASYTLVLADAGRFIQQNVATANNLTVPENSSVAFPIGTQILIRQMGAGQITLIAGSGVTLQSADNALKSRVQFAAITLVKVNTNTWAVMGDLTN